MSRPAEGRCAYCGRRCRGHVCRAHADLTGVDPAYNRAVVAAERDRRRKVRKGKP